MSIKPILVLLVLILLASPIQAKLGSQSFPDINFKDDIVTEAEIEISETKFSDPGTLPDSPLYVIKKTKENIQLSLAFDEEEEAKVHLELSKKRLAEARELSKQKKEKHAKKAIEEHKKELEKAKGKIEENKELIKEQEDIEEQSSIVLEFVIEKPEKPEEIKEDIVEEEDKKPKEQEEKEETLKKTEDVDDEEDVEEEEAVEEEKRKVPKKDKKEQEKIEDEEITIKPTIQKTEPQKQKEIKPEKIEEETCSQWSKRSFLIAKEDTGECKIVRKICSPPEGWIEVNHCVNGFVKK